MTDIDTDTPATPATPAIRRSYRRRAAVIASAIALPLTIVLALAFTAGRRSPAPSGPPPVLAVSAFPDDPTTDATCGTIIQKLPVTLGTLATRRVSSTSQSVVAWGDPAVVLRCGVPRPAALTVNSADELIVINDVLWYYTGNKSATVFTAVDRKVYVEVTMPAKYTADETVGPIAAAIGASTPALCVGQPLTGTPVPAAQLCTHRS